MVSIYLPFLPVICDCTGTTQLPQSSWAMMTKEIDHITENPLHQNTTNASTALDKETRQLVSLLGSVDKPRASALRDSNTVYINSGLSTLHIQLL